MHMSDAGPVPATSPVLDQIAECGPPTRVALDAGPAQSPLGRPKNSTQAGTRHQLGLSPF